MSSHNGSENIASQIAHLSSNIALAAFERHIEKKLNEATENQKETENSKSNVNFNQSKSF